MKDSCDEKDPSVCSAVGGACGQACNSPDKDCCAYWNMTGNIDSHKAGCCDVWYNNKDSSHQSFCCEDDAWAQSHSDWCDTCKPGSDNYYSNQCCNKRYSANAFVVLPPTDPLAGEYKEYLNYTYDEDACKCACSQNSESYFCKHYCCPKKPSSDYITNACCTQWENAGVLKNSGYENKCCQDTQDTSYCKATTTQAKPCKVTWNVYTIGGSSENSSGGIYAAVTYDGPWYDGGSWIRIHAWAYEGGPGFEYTCTASTDNYYSKDGVAVTAGTNKIAPYQCHRNWGGPAPGPAQVSCIIEGNGTSAGTGVAPSGTKISENCSGSYETSDYGECGKSGTTWSYTGK